MTATAEPRRPAPVTPVGAALVLAAVMLGAALVGVSVARAFPPAGDEAQVTLQRDTPVPRTPAPAPGLADVAPLVPFTRAGPGLPAPLEVVAGEWATADGQGRATDVGPSGAVAVLPAPDDATTVQVTLAVVRPGAGVVAGYVGPDRYVALRVERTGQAVEMVVVDGDPEQPLLLAVAPTADRRGPLVLALRRGRVGLEAYANGELVGRRILDEPDGPWRVGLVTGHRARADEARFDDLIVA